MQHLQRSYVVVSSKGIPVHIFKTNVAPVPSSDLKNATFFSHDNKGVSRAKKVINKFSELGLKLMGVKYSLVGVRGHEAYQASIRCFHRKRRGIADKLKLYKRNTDKLINFMVDHNITPPKLKTV